VFQTDSPVASVIVSVNWSTWRDARPADQSTERREAIERIQSITLLLLAFDRRRISPVKYVRPFGRSKVVEKRTQVTASLGFSRAGRV